MKWELTNAAIARIKKRALGSMKTGEFEFKPWELLFAAMAPEDYADKRKKAEQLIQYWIREKEMHWLCSQCFDALCYERRELREAGGNLMKGIRQLGRMKL